MVMTAWNCISIISEDEEPLKHFETVELNRSKTKNTLCKLIFQYTGTHHGGSSKNGIFRFWQLQTWYFITQQVKYQRSNSEMFWISLGLCLLFFKLPVLRYNSKTLKIVRSSYRLNAWYCNKSKNQNVWTRCISCSPAHFLWKSDQPGSEGALMYFCISTDNTEI